MCKSNLLSFRISFEHWEVINITESVCIFLNEVKSLTKFVSDLSCEVRSSVFLISDEEDCIDVQKMCKDLRKLRDNDDVKAVVLRVNSPGGSGAAIHHVMEQKHDIAHVKDVTILAAARDAIENGKELSLEYTIANTDRSVGAMLAGAVAKKYGQAVGHW